MSNALTLNDMSPALRKVVETRSHESHRRKSRMRETRSSRSVEGVMSNRDSYSDKKLPEAQRTVVKVRSCYQSPLNMPPIPIVRRRNIPAKVRYGKPRHLEM